MKEERRRKNVIVRVTKEEHEQISKTAKAHGISQADLIRLAVRMYIKTYTKE